MSYNIPKQIQQFTTGLLNGDDLYKIFTTIYKCEHEWNLKNADEWGFVNQETCRLFDGSSQSDFLKIMTLIHK